ncbi:MAG: S9 family peptidase [Firmicutes bacterium]|nr:S9 family peptidase [Bacillota bacterium]
MTKLELYLSVGSCKEVRWLDGQHLIYVKADPSGKSIVCMDVLTGEAKTLYTTPEQIWKLAVKDGTILFTSDDGGNENEQIWVFRDGKPVKMTDLPKVRHYVGGMGPGGKTVFFSLNERDSRSFDLACMDLETGEKKVLKENSDNYNTPCSVSPDGRYVLYNKLMGHSNSALWMLDTVTCQAVRRPDTAAVMAGKSPSWLPDSSGFYYVSDEDSDFFYVAFCDAKTGRYEKVLEFGWDAECVSLSPDGRKLAMTVNENGYSVLRVWDIEKKEFVKAPELPRGVMSSPAWDPEGKRLAFTLMTGTLAQDVWVADLEKDCAKQLSCSFPEGLGPDDFVEPELHCLKSFDGLTVPYFLYVPKGMEAKDLPVMISIHGGPEGQSRPGVGNKGLIYYYISQGIAIVEPNVRGSVGYGKAYSHLDDVEKRLDSVKDIEYLVKHLTEEGIADPKRLGVMGGSYGGFMTLSCAARYPELWCCAVATVGMFNLVTFLENTSQYRRPHREQEYGTLEHDRETLFNVSPAAKVDGIRGPLFVIHGKNDPRVPVTETYQVVEYLKNKGVDVTMLVYDDEGHGLQKFHNKVDCYPKVLEFVKKHMGL